MVQSPPRVDAVSPLASDMTLGPGHVQTQWMRLLVATLRDAGIEHFIISPGSRSTPIVAALQRESFHLHLCVDERAAAFVALGVARALGRPAALVCTSGTAGAHYYPAVIEAAQSDLPVLILTADRPPELQENASAQTINQHHLFGGYARGFFDLGSPDARAAALRGLRRKLVQAVALTRGPRPGPVHLNVPAYKPLEPEEPTSDAERAHARATNELAQLPIAQVYPSSSTPTAETALEVAHAWAQAKRPLLFCGPYVGQAQFDAVAAFVRRTGWPVLAEITHPLRQLLAGDALLCDAFDVIARARPASLTPDLVVSIGATATSSAWQEWLAKNPSLTLHAVQPHAYADPYNRLERLVQCDPNTLFAALRDEVSAADPAWAVAWTRANGVARSLARSALLADAMPEFSEADVFAELGKTLQDQDALFLGNSLPIRVAETFLSSASRYRCVSQRGVNGIDGLIAGAVGTALASRGRTLLVLGDVSALHDLGSLQLLCGLKPSLLVCILDNRGGRIFDGLPVARVASNLDPWTTPHEHDLAAVARALRLPTWSVATRQELSDAIAQRPQHGPAVFVCNVDPTGAQRVYAQLRESAMREFEP